ncbi:uncharacterized protein LOC135943748 [Cloeon dipterum]|uniref:uncharacterized protein LOC135943748 n=1 Tax=Cloeon dipterum TaxID=197152 RepID=UPI00322044B3
MDDSPTRESNNDQEFESSEELEFDPKASLEEELEFVNKCRSSIPAILIAAEFGDLEVCRELVLNLGADVNVTDKNGNDVYHCAAKNSCENGLQLIDFFATHGAEMERRNNFGLDAVILALRQRNFEFAIKLFNYYDSPNSFLSHCICEKLETLKFAFEKDASVVKVKGSDEFDREISYEVAWMHSLETFKWIIEIAGSSNLVESEEWQLKILEHAARNDEAGEDIARFMFSSYATNLTSEDLTTLLGVVMYSCFLPFVNLKVIALLIEHGADVNVSIEGKTLFDYCVAENSLRTAQFLYELDQEKTICSRTLFYAAWKADVAIHFSFVVDISTDEEEQFEEFDQSASLKEKLEFIHSGNCCPKIPAILHAAEFGDLEVCKELLEQGEDVNATDEHGYDVYHCASLNKICGLELIDLFAAHGAEMKRISRSGFDAVSLALSDKNVEFAIKLFNLYEWPNSFLSCYLRKSNDLELMKLAFEKDPSVAKVKGEDGFDRKISYNLACWSNLEVFKWIIHVARSVEEDVVKQKEWQLQILKYSAFNDHGEDIVNFMFSSLIRNLTRQDLTPLLVTVVSSRMPQAVNVKVVGLLIKHGADVNASIKGKSLLDHYVALNLLSAAKYMHELNPKEICASTLNYAAAKADVEMCHWLVGRRMAPKMKDLIPDFLNSITRNHQHGANLIRHFAPILSDYVNIASGMKPYDLKSPLQSAMDNKNLRVAEALLEIGADLNVRYRTLNLLIYCLGINFLEGAIFVYSKDKSQLQAGIRDTAMHIAKMYKNLDMELWLRIMAVHPFGH